MNTFFITGFPRSRTAWLANFLTYKDSFCFHDLSMDRATIQDMKDTLHSLGFCRYAGNSDSALFLYPQDMKALFPDSQYVLIKRDVNEVLASSRKLFPVNEKWLLDVAYPKLIEFERDFKPLVVKYEDLKDVETCLKIWEHCIPTVPFNFTRWSMLDRLKVEINDKEVKKIGDILCQQCG